jgi:hypothetical protein
MARPQGTQHEGWPAPAAPTAPTAPAGPAEDWDGDGH